MYLLSNEERNLFLSATLNGGSFKFTWTDNKEVAYKFNSLNEAYEMEDNASEFLSSTLSRVVEFNTLQEINYI
jgi:hypothetical protein